MKAITQSFFICALLSLSTFLGGSVAQAQSHVYCEAIFDERIARELMQLQSRNTEKNILYAKELSQAMNDQLLEGLGPQVIRDIHATVLYLKARLASESKNTLVLGVGNSMIATIEGLKILGYANAHNFPMSLSNSLGQGLRLYAFQKREVENHIAKYFEHLKFKPDSNVIFQNRPQKIILIDYVVSGRGIAQTAELLKNYFEAHQQIVEIEIIAFQSERFRRDDDIASSAKLGFSWTNSEIGSAYALKLQQAKLKPFMEYPSYLPGVNQIDFNAKNPAHQVLVKFLQEELK